MDCMNIQQYEPNAKPAACEVLDLMHKHTGATCCRNTFRFNLHDHGPVNLLRFFGKCCSTSNEPKSMRPQVQMKIVQSQQSKPISFMYLALTHACTENSGHTQAHTDTHRHTHRHTHTQTHTDTHKHTNTQTHTDTHTDSPCTEHSGHTQTHTDTHRHTDTHTDTHRHTHRRTQTQTQRHTNTQRFTVHG